jgi:hypothetical protein
MKFLICISAFLFCLTSLYAQDVDTTGYSEPEYTAEAYSESSAEEEGEEASVHTPISPDELTHTYKQEKIPVKKFDSKKWKEVVSSTDYNEIKPPEDKSNDKKSSINMNTPRLPWNGGLLQILFYTAAVIVLVFLVASVLKNLSIKIKKENNFAQPDDTITVENIEDINVTSLLQRAIADGNFRLAARLYYLDLLKKLNEQGIIVWKKNKTNRDYLTEIFSRDEYFEDVRWVTLAYEQAWYGEHALTPVSFQQLASRFEGINHKLTATTTL